MTPQADAAETTIELAFGFAGCHALVSGGDGESWRLIERSLGLCRATGGLADAPVARFEIAGDARTGYSLARDDSTPLASGLNAFDLRERLLYELTLAIARGVRRWPVFHAAGLAWGENGLVLAGVSGAGKSTLTSRLLALGADFLSDELVALSPDGGVMVGFPRPIVLKDGGRALAPGVLAALRGAPSAPEPDGAVRLYPAGLDRREGAIPARPRIVAFPRFVAGAPTTRRTISRAAAIYRLLPGLMNASRFADRGLAAVGGALSGVEAVTLEYGDGEAAAAELVRLVGRLR